MANGRGSRPARAVVQEDRVLTTEGRRRTAVAEHEIEVAIAVEVAAGDPDRFSPDSRQMCARDVAERALSVVQVEPVPRREDPVSDEQVRIPIPVHVGQHDGARVVEGMLRQPGCRHLGEGPLAIVQVEAVLSLVPEDEVEIPVAVHVSDRYGPGEAHADRHLRGSRVAEGPLSIVQIEQVLVAVASENEVQVAIGIHVGERDRRLERQLGVVGKTALRAVPEPSLAVVQVELRPVLGPENQIAVSVPVHVARGDEYLARPLWGSHDRGASTKPPRPSFR